MLSWRFNEAAPRADSETDGTSGISGDQPEGSGMADVRAHRLWGQGQSNEQRSARGRADCACCLPMARRHKGPGTWQGCCIAVWGMQNTSALSWVLALCQLSPLPQAPLIAQASGTCKQTHVYHCDQARKMVPRRPASSRRAGMDRGPASPSRPAPPACRP